MKKLLLTMVLPFLSASLFAQVITSENFNAIPVGDVGTDITGLTSSYEMYTISGNGLPPTTATNAGNDNFQIVASDATHVNVLQITGTNGDKGSRQLYFGDFTTSWEFREAGNNIVEAEFDMFTGAGGGPSKNLMGLYIYNADRTKILGGFSYNTDTRVISGLAYYDATAQGGMVANYFFYLGTGAQNIILAPNVWVRLGVSFNKTTGQVLWKGPGINGQVPGAAAATDPDRVSLISVSGSVPAVVSPPTPAVPNTAAAVTLFDNIITRASATDTLLGVEEIAAVNTKYSVFPNPANSVINVSNENGKIAGVTLTDLNGRIVKQNAFDNLSNVQIDISDLSVGMYMMEITSEQGTATKKIIKN